MKNKLIIMLMINKVALKESNIAKERVKPDTPCSVRGKEVIMKK
jgi:hypothetical protein